MPLLETAFVAIVANPVGKFLFKQAFGDSLVADMSGNLLDTVAGIFTGDKEQKEVEKRFRQMGEEVARGLWPLFAEERDLDEAALEAVAYEVGATLESAINTRVMVDKNLDATKLEEALRSSRIRAFNLLGARNGAEQALLFRAFKEIAPQFISLAPQMKDFQVQVFGRLLSQSADIKAELKSIHNLIEMLPSAEKIDEWLAKAAASRELEYARYESRYLNAVWKNYDYMELFGVDFKESERNQPDLLQVAYVSLNLQRQEGEKTERFDAAEFFDVLQPDNNRLLICGQAGSGKSTLFRWVATEAARWHLGLAKPSRRNERMDYKSRMGAEEIEGEREVIASENPLNWRHKVPFLLRLRYLQKHDGKLPPPDLFPLEVGNSVNEPPDGWMDAILDSGRALILVDGIDEVPPQKRRHLQQSLKDYFENRGKNYFVVNTRPSAIKDWSNWLRTQKVPSAHINEMSRVDQEELIRRWHEAVSLTMQARGEDASEVAQHAKDLLETLEDHPAARLAVYPLLCAMICALHLWRKRRLPTNYWDLCEELCAMLLHKRAEDSDVPEKEFPPCYGELSYAQKRSIAGRLANFMVHPDWKSSIARADALTILREELDATSGRQSAEAEVLLEALLDRSGLLKENSVDSVDFIHNTLKEFLAANALVDAGETEILFGNLADPQWEPILLFAAGHDRNRNIGSQLIERLLASSERAHQLMALKCAPLARFKRGELEARLTELENQLFPPKNNAEAETIAAALGNEAVPRLLYREGLSEDEAKACVVALGKINTRRSRKAAESYIPDERVFEELAQVINPLLIPKALNSVFNVNYEGYKEDWRHQNFDLSILSNRSHTTCLNLHSTHVNNDIAMIIGEFKQLQLLDISDTQISDLNLLHNITHLQSLRLSGTRVIDFNPLQILTHLQTLILVSTSITDLTPLNNLTHLQTLYLSSTLVSDLKPLQHLTQLTNLYLNATPTRDLAPLQNLTQLKDLDLTNTLVSDLMPLQNLTQLRRLALNDTQVSNLTPLQNLKRLQVLYLSKENQTSIKGLEGLESKIRWI